MSRAAREPKTMKRVRAVLLVLIALLVVGFAWKTRDEAHKLVTNPRATRKVAHTTPADRKLPYEDVNVTTADGLKLKGWWVPALSEPRGSSQGESKGATVIIVHGYKDERSSMLGLAEI